MRRHTTTPYRTVYCDECHERVTIPAAWPNDVYSCHACAVASHDAFVREQIAAGRGVYCGCPAGTHGELTQVQSGERSHYE